MQRGAFAVVLAAVVGLHGGCKGKSKSKDQPAPVAATPAPAAPTPPGRVVPSPGGGLPPATAPDPGYEARRAELLRRGNPEMMKDAPVMVTTAPDVKPDQIIKPLGKDLVAVGKIKVDLAAGRLEVPAKMASPTAPLEYIAVTPAGKAYESLLTVDTNAIELRLALSLIGFEGTVPSATGELPPATAADSVLVAAVFGGKERPIASLLMDRRVKKAPKDTPWQVVGFRPEDRDQALLTKDFLTLVERDRFAPLRYTIDPGNPYAGPNEGYSGNPKAFPPGGEITLVIKRQTPVPPEVRAVLPTPGSLPTMPRP